jgi:hypothetical protein
MSLHAAHVVFGFNLDSIVLCFSNSATWPRYRHFCKNLSQGKAGEVLKQANSGTSLAVKAINIKRKITQVSPVAQEGKPRPKIGSKTQTNRILGHLAGKTGISARSFRLGMALNAAQLHIFKIELRALGVFRYLQWH